MPIADATLKAWSEEFEKNRNDDAAVAALAREALPQVLLEHGLVTQLNEQLTQNQEEGRAALDELATEKARVEQVSEVRRVAIDKLTQQERQRPIVYRGSARPLVKQKDADDQEWMWVIEREGDSRVVDTGTGDLAECVDRIMITAMDQGVELTALQIAINAAARAPKEG